MWVGRGWQTLNAADRIIWAKAYGTTLLNRFGVGIAALCLATSGFALFLPADFLHLSQTLQAAGAPMSPLGYLMVLDWSALMTQPWQWFYLPSWVLTILMFCFIDHHAKHIAKGAAPDTRAAPLNLWMWVGNLRTLLTNFGLLIALWYFLSAIDAWGQATRFVASLL